MEKLMRKVNYLNNRDLLAEIHKSKNTFSSFTDEGYDQFDIILPSIDKINIRTTAEAKRNKAKRLGQKDYETRKADGEKIKQADCDIDYRKINKTDVVFRIMMFDHIPDDKGRKKKPKTIADTKEKLKIPEHEVDQVGKIFNKAKEDSLGYEPYAQQIAQIYGRNSAVLDEVINILFYIAEADGKVSDSEVNYIKNVSTIFGLNANQFEGIREARVGSHKQNPYIILGCNPNDDLQTIRKKYLKLSKEHHPDALISKGLPKELITESEKKLAAINSAYDKIEKMKS